jgi:hypothetical protein
MGNKKSRFGVEIPQEIHSMSSDEALPIISKAVGGRVLVSFSGGKDSVGCVLALREHFPDMQLYHMYTIPGLRLVEEGLTYYERLWGQRIIRLPDPWLWRSYQDFAFQPYHRVPLIKRFEPVTTSYDEIAREIRRDLGWTKEVPQAVGIRADDSIFRAAALKKSGAYQRTRHVIYPVFDWTRHKLRAELIRTGTRLSPDYAIMKRSFSGEGLDFRFIEPIRKHYPDDYAKMKEYWPLLDAELMRYIYQRRRDQVAMRQVSGFTL